MRLAHRSGSQQEQLPQVPSAYLSSVRTRYLINPTMAAPTRFQGTIRSSHAFKPQFCIYSIFQVARLHPNITKESPNLPEQTLRPSQQFYWLYRTQLTIAYQERHLRHEHQFTPSSSQAIPWNEVVLRRARTCFHGFHNWIRLLAAAPRQASGDFFRQEPATDGVAGCWVR